MRLIHTSILACLLIGQMAFAAAAAEDQRESSQPQRPIEQREFRGLQTVDWIVIGVYGVSMIGLGWFYSRRQSSTEEYFLAGRRTKSFIAGISLFATLLSTISYLGTPGEIIKNGPIFFAGCLAAPLVYLVVGYVVIPILMRVPVTSAYELLESRVGLAVRLLGSLTFMATRLVWMALLLYLSAKALVVMLGWDLAAVPCVIAVLGVIAVIYTTLGGLRAVMVTDVVQFFILFSGALLTIGCITAKLGGIGAWWPTDWSSHWAPQPLFSLSPTVRVTLVGSMVYYFLFWVCASVSDQVTIQRYLSTCDAKTARRAFLTSIIADLLVMVLLMLTGLALLGFFQHYPAFLPEGRDPLGNADFLFPHYIANFLPVGIAGLVVSAMLAAAMSSLDSGLNSITTVFSVDVLGRFGDPTRSDRSRLRIARGLTFGLGALVVFLACFIGMIPGNIFEVAVKSMGLFFAPLAGIFIMALFVPWANGIGTIIGAACGFATALLVAYWDVITGGPTLSFQWITPCALIVHVAVGSLISALPMKRVSNRASEPKRSRH